MPKRNRATLRKSFADGEMPTSEGFSDLIESMICTLDDGIDYTKEDGLRLRQIDSDRLLSFYRDTDVLSVIWSVAIDNAGNSLTINAGGQDAPWITLANEAPNVSEPALPRAANGHARPARALAPKQVVPRVGINQPKPTEALDVGGTVASDGRIGRRGSQSVLADGAWYPICRQLRGCTALEVTAGVGRQKSGKYALMHAFALSAFNAKNDITYHQAHHDSKCNRIELRWVVWEDENHKPNRDYYDLEIRTGCDYGPGIAIQYYLTKLWFDPEMDDCRVDPPAGGTP